ncbi:zinc-dependent peptidase [Sungkyunkwania multivorans]|uniref:Zinc-dependent peptidase n=1 Tax=Sungkyunkwania multivorans TaxID=1173618 RepID=A0ABW3CZF4_9FLAO
MYFAYFLAGFLVCLISYHGFRFIETIYARKSGRPFFIHFYPFRASISNQQRYILEQRFPFFTKLDFRNKEFFEHRLATFLNEKSFEGREGLEITDELKILISATAIMLTFGMREYMLDLVEKIIIYPTRYYSRFNGEYHIGEFNPKFKALVFSWEDFKKGFDVENDNRNLGIHEFAHAIHLSSIKNRDTSSTIFSDGFRELELMLLDEQLRTKLQGSDYFRDYAFTNKFEFVAVVLENFIETPNEFRREFPEVYEKVKRMLNFDYAGY